MKTKIEFIFLSRKQKKIKHSTLKISQEFRKITRKYYFPTFSNYQEKNILFSSFFNENIQEFSKLLIFESFQYVFLRVFVSLPLVEVECIHIFPPSIQNGAKAHYIGKCLEIMMKIYKKG